MLGLAALVGGVMGAAAMPAGAVTVDGVTFTPGDMFAVSNFFQNSPSGAGQQLQAIGQVTQIISPISGTPNNTVCSGCELNFVVTGYTNTTGPGSTLGFTGGTITLYVDATGTFNQNAGFAAQATAIAGGQAFLDLSGHANQNGFTLTAQLIQNGQVTNGQGSGLLDALTGPGAADQYFTNLNDISDGHGGFADLEFSSTVNNINPPGGFSFNGGAQIQTIPNVPEPATMAVLGSSLLAFGFIRRRKQS
jgi:PEP-CTERM motif